MSSSSNHTLEELKPDRQGRYPCQHCKARPEKRPRAVAEYSFECDASRRTFRRQTRSGHLCLEHAVKFAARHGLELPRSLLFEISPTDEQVIEILAELRAEADAEIAKRGRTVARLRRSGALRIARIAYERILEAADPKSPAFSGDVNDLVEQVIDPQIDAELSVEVSTVDERARGVRSYVEGPNGRVREEPETPPAGRTIRRVIS